MIIGIDGTNSRAGGALTHLAELLDAVKPQEHGIKRIIIWAGRHAVERLPQRPWIETVYEPFLDGSPFARLYWQTTRLTQLAEEECDVLFVRGGRYVGGFKPFVTLSPSLLPFEVSEVQRYGFSWKALRQIGRRIAEVATFGRADGLVFLTEYARSVVSKQVNFPLGNTRVIPHGVNDCFRCKPRPQRSISSYSVDNPFRLLYVSQIEPYKHHCHVIDAMSKLREKGMPILLQLVGPPGYAIRRLQAAISRFDPTETFVRYQGKVPFSEMCSTYHEADAFVFASSCEAFGQTLLEAMASGLPIACSEQSAMSEILGDAGVYFDPEQPTDIANALRELLRAPDLREQKAWKAYQRAHRYSWERCAKETFSFLIQVAEEFPS
jgi:glycosyltransferase involved in cell wall biosynthesis